MIIALSREGALSVFGRGQLAVDFTAQLQPTEPPPARGRQLEPAEAQPRVPKILTVDIPDSPAEATVVRAPEKGREPQGKRPDLDLPTQIGVMPEGLDLSGETKYARPPSDTDGEGARSPDPSALRAQPVRNAGSSQSYRDDEMTVMMDAPPRGLGGKVKEALVDDEGPTRASVPVEDDGRTPMTLGAQVPASAGLRGRAIREKNARADDRDERPRRDPAEEQRPRKNLQVHRTTVGTRDLEPAPRREAAPVAHGAPDDTLAELSRPPPRVGWLVPAALLLGVVLLVAAAVVFLLDG